MLELWPKAIIEERNISMLHSFFFFVLSMLCFIILAVYIDVFFIFR